MTLANTLPGMGRAKAIPRENAINLARVLRPYVEAFPSQTAAAKAWGIAQSHLSQLLLAEGKGAGIAVLIRIRAALNLSLDELLGLPPLRQVGGLRDEIRAALRAELAEIRKPADIVPLLLPPKGTPDAPRPRRR